MASPDRTAPDGASFIPVTRDQRNALRRYAWIDLTGADDLARIAESSNDSLEYLLMIRERCDTALWLLDDLGWERHDPRDTFYVTLSPERFERWLRGVKEDLDSELEGLAELIAHPERTRSRSDIAVEDARDRVDAELDTRHACDSLLKSIAR